MFRITAFAGGARIALILGAGLLLPPELMESQLDSPHFEAATNKLQDAR